MRWVLIIACSVFCSGLFAQGNKGFRPDFLQFQYGGSVGFISGGVGYDLFRERARVSVHFGHVPNNMGGPLNIFSTKFLVVPATYRLSDRLSISPFDIGLMVSYHLGEDFRTRWPTHRYPEHYYWWQTSFRFHLNYQPSLNFVFHPYNIFKHGSIYLDVNSNELYLVSYFQNTHALKFLDVVKLGAGIRLHY